MSYDITTKLIKLTIVLIHTGCITNIWQFYVEITRENVKSSWHTLYND